MNNNADFSSFFRKATGHAPYPYQKRFAESGQLPHLLRAPTSAGKTATAILGWLWRLKHSGKPTPRRLAYCLPMRVLVEQSFREATRWLENLGLGKEVGLHLLMGGVDTEQWYLQPEKPAILVGTQDMLLSRALNRGYAASRFHWPIDFGLLNNDCLWVYDEPQLMGSGVSTSAQMAGLRASIGTAAECPSLWMSATLEPVWLETVDFQGKFANPPLELTAADFDPALPLYKRMTAAKKLGKLDASPSKDMKDIAAAITKVHVNGTQTLIVVNTVDRAKALYDALQKSKNPSANVMLVHSRFRPKEREELNERLQEKGDVTTNRLIVATQVVEAGVDISSRTLITELAPWSSIVQRVGRCNRTGDDSPGAVFWIDLSDEKLALPYEIEQLNDARSRLEALNGQDVSPQSLEDFKRREGFTLSFEHTHVLRSKDLLDLFDTAPDLSGNDIDIQRFVRGDDDDADLQVFWRDLADDAPEKDEPRPQRRELCNVPVFQFRNFMKKNKAAAFRWDHLDEKWVQVRDPELRPGLVLLLSSSEGGYSRDRGWDPDATRKVVTVLEAALAQPAEGVGDDPNSSGPPLLIAQHTENVVRRLNEVLSTTCFLTATQKEQLRKAARWHDAGKAHAAFQVGLRRANPELAADALWAKSGTNKRLRHGRAHFRHELASALAAMQQNLPFPVVYLIGSHHGRVRISIRSLPNEDVPADPVTLFALGVHDGDVLPKVNLGGEVCPEMILSLAPMQLGGDGSWTAKALALRDEIGVFTLGLLEALLRAADFSASQAERKETSHV